MIHVVSGSPYESEYGFSRAVRIHERTWVAGTAPIDGDVVPESAHDQMLLCGRIIAEALEKADASIDDVVRTRMYLVDPTDADEVGRAHKKIFSEATPVATMVVVAGLLDPRWKVEVEAEADSTPRLH
jgi:enamine deaminase RidA (YjgF/YER057c/UK114 family)